MYCIGSETKDKGVRLGKWDSQEWSKYYVENRAKQKEGKSLYLLEYQHLFPVQKYNSVKTEYGQLERNGKLNSICHGNLCVPSYIQPQPKATLFSSPLHF